MRTIARLFGKSPFAPLQTHMNKVAACIEKLGKIFDAFDKGDNEKMERLAGELSDLEHAADITKNDIRNHLPKSLFLPIDRGQFLEILSIQDALADKAEEIAILLTLRPADCHHLQLHLHSLFQKNAEVFWHAKQIIAEIDELLETSFGGIEAEKVKVMVEQTAYKEYEAKKLQRHLTKQLFSLRPEPLAPLFYLGVRLIAEIGSLSQLAERLANRIRMILELK